MARDGPSRSKKQREEESSSESDGNSRRRQRPGPSRSKKRKDESSEEESSSGSSEADSSDSAGSSAEESPPRRKAKNRRPKEDEESSADESPPRHKGKHRRPKEDEDSSADERSPPPRRKAPAYRSKKDDASEESESEQGFEDRNPRRAGRGSPYRRPERSSDEASPQRRGAQIATAPSPSDSDVPRPREQRKPRPSELDEAHGLGNMDSPLSPPPGYIDGPDDALEKALKASTLQAKKTPKRDKWVENDNDMRKAMEASKRAAKKAPARKEWVEDEKSLQEALKATKRAAKKAPRHPNNDEEEELRRILELSQQETHRPSAQQDDDDEELKRILEASKQDASEHEARLKEARAQKAREQEVLKDSNRTLEEDRKRQKAAQKLAEEEYQKQKRDAIWENKAEWKSKQARRKQATAWEKQRAREIAEEQRESRRAEREQQARAAAQDAAATRNSGQRAGGQYWGRPGRLHTVREDDDDDAGFQEQLRAAQAASLGDTGAQSIPTIDEEGWAIEDMPPSYPEINRSQNRTVLNPEKYTTSTRDIAKGGSKIPLTDQLKKEMIQYACRMRVAAGEALESPNDPKPPAYKKTGSKAEAKALKKLVTSAVAARKTTATAIVDHQVRQNNNRDFGHREAAQGWMNDQNRRDLQQQQARDRRENVMNRPFTRIQASGRQDPRSPAARVDPRNRI